MEQWCYVYLAAVVSIVYNQTVHDDPRMAWRAGLRHFALFVVVLFAAGWLALPFRG